MMGLFVCARDLRDWQFLRTLAVKRSNRSEAPAAWQYQLGLSSTRQQNGNSVCRLGSTYYDV